jgi:hypothetical protein
VDPAELDAAALVVGHGCAGSRGVRCVGGLFAAFPADGGGCGRGCVGRLGDAEVPAVLVDHGSGGRVSLVFVVRDMAWGITSGCFSGLVHHPSFASPLTSPSHASIPHTVLHQLRVVARRKKIEHRVSEMLVVRQGYARQSFVCRRSRDHLDILSAGKCLGTHRTG